jgi:hypothetical protein
MFGRERLAAMTEPQLRAINEAVVGEIRLRQTQREMQASSQFRVGQVVTWYSDKRNKQVYIKVGRINPKSLAGDECNADGTSKPIPMTWRVSPTMVKAV